MSFPILPVSLLVKRASATIIFHLIKLVFLPKYNHKLLDLYSNLIDINS